MKSVIAAALLSLVSAMAWAIDPCCTIKSIDLQSGIVTAADNRTGTTFRFQASPALARGLKLGQAVTADFKTGAVTIAGVEHHFSILPSPISPCCGIVSVDAAHGVATARVNATGMMFQVIFDGAKPPQGLTAGQSFDANFQSGIAAIGGGKFRILNIAAGATKVFPADPCCTVQAINTQARTLTVADSSGKLFQVLVTNPASLANIKVGSKLFANARHDVFSVDSASPCCNVVVP